jgi:SAM-dependent methyltransferase
MSATFSYLPPPSLACGNATGDVTAFGSLAFPRPGPRPHRTAPRDDGPVAKALRREAEVFIGRLALGPGLDVLDVASGTGFTAVAAARTGADVTAVDDSPCALRGVAARAKRSGVVLSLREGDVEGMPFFDRSFDVVVSMFGATFAAHPAKVVDELARVTRPGGIVALAGGPGAEHFDDALWDLATHVRSFPIAEGRALEAKYLEVVATRL